MIRVLRCKRGNLRRKIIVEHSQAARVLFSYEQLLASSFPPRCSMDRRSLGLSSRIYSGIGVTWRWQRQEASPRRSGRTIRAHDAAVAGAQELASFG